MIIQVTPHTITITKTEDINAGEYNITPCIFEFSEEYEGLTNEAVFTNCSGTNIIVPITNNQCVIPFEVLETSGNVLLGVYGYESNNGSLVLRYSPKAQYFYVKEGSYQEGEEPTPPTPGVWDNLIEQVEKNTNDIEEINTTIDSLSPVATSGNYDDLTNKPTIPTSTSQLNNDSGFITKNVNDLTNYSTTTQMNNAIGVETTNRINADNNLQEQIDGITASTDVVDIVGTYQELQNYDTQHLGNNDIIKVLQDSTHNNAMTYYRWNKNDSIWVYVGQEGPYYTKSESDSRFELVENKVTTLSASSTDTQYPTAKCMYDLVGNVESLLETLDIGSGV